MAGDNPGIVRYKLEALFLHEPSGAHRSIRLLRRWGKLTPEQKAWAEADQHVAAATAPRCIFLDPPGRHDLRVRLPVRWQSGRWLFTCLAATLHETSVPELLRAIGEARSRAAP